MVNGGFFNRVSDSLNPDKKDTKEYKDYTLPGRIRHKKSSTKDPSIFHGAVVHPHIFESYSHYNEGKDPQLCEKMYSGDSRKCEECQKPNPFGGKDAKGNPSKNYAPRSFGFLVFVPELWDFDTNSPKKTESGFDMNPVRFVEMSFGKDQVNRNAIQDKVDSGEFIYSPDINNIFKFKKAEKLSPPSLLSSKEMKALETQMGKIVVPESVLDKYGAMSIADISSLMLNNFTNVKWDFPELVSVGVKNPNVRKSKEENKNTVLSSDSQEDETEYEDDEFENLDS